MIFARRLRRRNAILLSVALVAVIGCASFLILLSQHAESSQTVDLPGAFPATVDAGSDIVHMRLLELNAESQITLQTDYWYRPSTGRYKEEIGRPGEELSSAVSFNGDRLLAFDRDASYAADYTIAAYEASALAFELDPRKDSVNHAAAVAKEVREAVAAKRLVEEDAEVRNGRKVTRYRMATAQAEATKWVVVDDATALPLEEQALRKSDGAIITSKAYDYEVISADSDRAAISELTLPPEITSLTDKDLPVDPSSLDITVAQAAQECSFDILWLGDRYKGVPLHLVRVTPDRSAVTLYYANTYGSAEANSQGPRNINLYEFSSQELLTTLVAGLEGAGAVSEQATVDGRAFELWTGGSIAPTVVIVRGATTIAISGTPGEQDTKAEANRILRVAFDLVEAGR